MWLKQTSEVPPLSKPSSPTEGPAQTCCHSEKSETALFLNRQNKHSYSRTLLTSYMCTAADDRKILPTDSVLASRKGREAVIVNIEKKFPSNALPVFVCSSPPVFCDGTVSSSTAQPKILFMVSKDSSNFAVNYSVAKISLQPMSRERVMFLRPSEDMHSATARAEKKYSEENMECSQESSSKGGR